MLPDLADRMEREQKRRHNPKSTFRSPGLVLYYKRICAELGRPAELLSYYRKCLKMELGGT